MGVKNIDSANNLIEVEKILQVILEFEYLKVCGESVYGRMKDFYGQSAFYHGGAINGFMSDVYYFPKLDISIGVFGEIWARYRVLISGE